MNASAQAAVSVLLVDDHPITRLGIIQHSELEVLDLIGLALKKSEIAGRLNLSVNTIERDRTSLKKKLKVNPSSELERFAILRVDGERGS